MVERAAAGTRRELVQRVLHSKLARAALVVLWLLYASAIYAPLIANDKPYSMRAADYGAYSKALGAVVALTRELQRELDVPREQWPAWHKRPLPVELQQRVREQHQAVRLQLDTLRAHLPAADQHRVALIDEALDKVLTVGTNSDRISAAAIAGAVVHEAESMPDELRARDPRHPEQGGRVLLASASHPLLESLSRIDVFVMSLWPLLTLALLARKRAWLGAALAAAFVSAALWPLAFAPAPRLSFSGIKAAIASGDLVVERALFPPFAFGVDETNSSEVLRPPTWLASSEIDAEGHYLRGPRRTSPDPVTGLMPASNPVRVLPREPERNSPWRHLLGTDSLGRDLLARLLWGGRTSLVVGAVAAALVVLIGVALGSLAGWFGRWVDALLSRVIVVFASFPAVFVIVVAAALIPTRALDPRIAIPLVIGLISWTSVARLVRGEVLRVKALDYVAAARALGLSDARILARHVLPNAIQPVIVAGAFLIGWGIFVEAGVSFLGFGVELPTPSWGTLLNDSRAGEHWWVQVFPGAAIAATVLAFHLLGEALRDALDPRAEIAP